MEQIYLILGSKFEEAQTEMRLAGVELSGLTRPTHIEKIPYWALKYDMVFI
jgi:hypothetical protein